MAGKKHRPARPTAPKLSPRRRVSKRARRNTAATQIGPLIDDIPGGICLVDEALRVRVANRAFRTLLSLPQRMIEPGSPVIDLIRHNAEVGAYGDMDPEAAIAARLQALRRRRIYTCPLAMPDGRKVELKGAPLGSGGYAIIATDVTEQRRAEELATLAHRRLLDAIESFAEGFALFDAADRLVLCNARYREMYAAIAHELKAGTTFERLVRVMASSPESTVPPERLEEHVASRLAYHRNPQGVLDVKRQNGRWIRMIDRRTIDGWTVCIRVDLTDIKRREAILSVVNDTAARLLSGAGWRAQVKEMLARLGPAAGVSRVTFSRNTSGADGVFHQEDIYEWDAPGVHRVIDDKRNHDPRLKDDPFQDWRARRSRGEVVYGLTRDLTPAQQEWYKIQGVMSAIRVPIMVNGEWWGTIGFDHCVDEHVWQPLEIDALRAAAGLVGLAINRDRVEAERHQIERALRESEQRFRGVAEAHPVPVVIVRLSDGVVVYASQASRSLFGFPDYVGSRAADYYANPEERRRLIEVIERDGGAEGVEVMMRKADGTVFPVAITSRRIMWEGEPAIVTGLFDLTEAKRAELEIARQREALAHTEKLTALGALLAGVAHELNNPLSVVVGQATMLKDLAGDAKIAARAEKIRSAADRCARIVKTFLAMARRRPPEVTAVDVNAIAEAALDLLAYNLRTTDVKIVVDLAPDLPRLMADADQINQVLTNLIINAQQALMERNPPRRLAITTRFDAARNVIRLSVADNGPGIRDELRERIFEPFFTTKPTGIGTGLGLSMCQGVVESHGGKIVVEDTPGGGATFSITIPVRGQVAAAVRASAQSDVERADRGDILVVDDEPEMAQTLAEILANAGHRVDVAFDGAEALEQLTRRDYDLVLSDLRMPVLDGPGLYQALTERRPAMIERIVFMTGDSLAPHVTAFLAATRVACIEKPLNPRAVLDIVARRLADRRALSG